VIVAIGMSLGVGSVWCYAAARTSFPFSLVAQPIAVLMVYTLAIASLTALVSRGRFSPGGAALVTLLALAWFFWPIWLSPALPGHPRLVAILAPAHPVFAVNAVLLDRLGYWAEQSIAYHYTALSDDVSYSLPTGVKWCVLLHAGIAIAARLLMSVTYRRVKVESPPQA